MFSLRLLDEVRGLIDLAKDSINNIVNSCKDTINLHITNNANGINMQTSNVVIAARDNVKNHTTAEANNIINSLMLGRVPVVKSVQRGVFSRVALPFTINLATINTNKSIVLINGRDNDGDVYKSTVNSNKIIINHSNGYNYPDAKASGDWEVVEYY